MKILAVALVVISVMKILIIMLNKLDIEEYPLTLEDIDKSKEVIAKYLIVEGIIGASCGLYLIFI